MISSLILKITCRASFQRLFSGDLQVLLGFIPSVTAPSVRVKTKLTKLLKELASVSGEKRCIPWEWSVNVLLIVNEFIHCAHRIPPLLPAFYLLPDHIVYSKQVHLDSG